jgi:hypothetical protein
MVYIIISNIGMAIMMLYVYFRYSHFRINSNKENKDLRAKLDAQTTELRSFDAKLLSSIKGYQDRVEGLLIEVGKVRQEKEKEMELRSEFEKKYEILNQKNNDYESVHSEITNAILNIVNDTHETAKNLGKDLYEKISDTYKKEAKENQNLISKVNQNVADFVTKFNSMQGQVIKEKEDYKFHELFQPANSEIAKNLILEIANSIKNKGFLINKNFFMPENFDEQKSKLMLCEIAFVKNNTLFILDFKGTNYIFEYFANRAKNDKMAEENFNIKFKRYLMLLGNARYSELINRAINSENSDYNSHKIIVIVPTKNEIKLLKDLQYYEKMRQLNFDICDIEDLNKIIS